MLEALAQGKCGKIEQLSFTDNVGFNQDPLSWLRRGLKACPQLSGLRMGTTKAPQEQIRPLVTMLDAGEMPLLRSLEIRVHKLVANSTVVEVEEGLKLLQQIAKSRVGCPVDLTIRNGMPTRDAND